ncbi:hypothetical protein NMG60_11004403 [Bertholletia excelsa]
MHGRRDGEIRIRSRHMWSVPTRGTRGTRTVASDSVASAADFFCKDGRKINIGDCALFKPPQDSPPFIGIIRCVTSNKEKNLQLVVNWLYRPAELKLGKSILSDAAPNEVFYSFHKDEIPAASLLHPCKVAFLPKGVELPSGISSFVCRRVYDIANKCLWWLTDQDYIDERQEEVDQLLNKTRVEMHATVQPGGRSPKPINGPTSSQLKSASDNVQSGASFHSQSKGKKRERTDQGSEPVKRERIPKTDGGDSGQLKPENILKSEISKITEKGGLVDQEGVEKLVQLMQPDRADRKMELTNRSMLAGVIAATENFDCLTLFVQLKGLPVLDEWLQDVHKGKVGDGSPKEGDKSVEEFLLILLRALDKLPVNLQALQMCHIGKSVNHLRSHKNLEIQKKARSLVDTWKKRVEAEMNVIDAKSGSTQAVPWSSRSRLPEVTAHCGNRHLSGPPDVAIKSSVTHVSASKNTSVKLVQGEINAKSMSSCPGPVRSALSPASSKDGQPRMPVGNDPPTTTAKEERSSSSSQSHNNSQSCSSDQAKTTGFSGKEDARSSTAGSISVNKMSSGSSRHRRSINGFPGSALSGGQKETMSSRSSSLHRNSASEKLSQSVLTCEKTTDVPIVEGNSHKLIVKIPNRGRSPAQSASGGSVDDMSMTNSRASSPVLSEKHDQTDRNVKGKNDTNRAHVSDMNTESWQSNDFKDILTGSDEGDGSPAPNPEEEQCRTSDDAAKLAETSKAASSSSGNDLKTGKLHEPSFSSINALIESCVKYSEVNASISLGDDVGMNLLASVAAAEISKANSTSPGDSPRINTPVIEDACKDEDSKVKSVHGNNLSKEPGQPADGAVSDMEQGVISGTLLSRDGMHPVSKQASGASSGDVKTTCSIVELKPAGKGNENCSSNLVLLSAVESCLETNERSDEHQGTRSVVVSPAIMKGKVSDGEESKAGEPATVTSGIADGSLDQKPKGSRSSLTEDKVREVLSNVKIEKEIEQIPSNPLLEEVSENKTDVKGLDDDDCMEKKPSSGKILSEHLEQTNEGSVHHSGSSKDLTLENVNKLNGAGIDEKDTKSDVSRVGKQKSDHVANIAPTNENQVLGGVGSAVSDQKSDGMEATVESKEILSGAAHQKESPGISTQEVGRHVRSKGSKMICAEADNAEESASTVADASSSPAGGASDMDTKPKFDLNEGFVADEGKYGESVDLAGPGCSSLHLVNPLPLSITSASSALPASITVAAAAKRPFVPPDDLLRSKVEIGWKGSAATSAFRPAEPRKATEMPLNTASSSLSDASAGKSGRLLLDIDLNVPDERIIEDMASRNSGLEAISASEHLSNHELLQKDAKGTANIRSSGGLDLDLNQVDEASDMGQYSSSINCRLEAPLVPVKLSSSGGFLNCEVRRDFDLNNGPVLDEASVEPSSKSQPSRTNMQCQPPLAGFRTNNSEMGTFSSWFPTANTYPHVTIPPMLSDRGEQSFPVVAATSGPARMLGPPSGGTQFSPDVYRGSVLSSSPALPFPSTPFQYPVFSFGSSFSLPSATFSGGSTSYMDSSSSGRLCFPPANSQLLGPAVTVSSQFPRPYVVGLPDGSNNVGVDNRKWGRQGLDLNAGPGFLDIEGRDETSPLTTRQLPVASSQALGEEHTRMYQQMVGGVLKRKEPEGGWDTESFRYKQASWQ